MSSVNALSTVTYTSVSSDSNSSSSWGIPLMNAGKILEMDPYEEVAQQGQAHPLSAAYVPDPMELDDHVLVYVPEPEHPKLGIPKEAEYDADFIDYPDKPEDGEEDDDEDPEEDPSEEREPEDDDNDDDTDDKDEEPTEDEEEEEHLALADSSVVPVVDPVPSARDTEAFKTDESAPTQDPPQTRPMIRMRDDTPEEMCHLQGRFVLTYTAALPGLIRNPGHDAWTIARAADRVEDVGYVRALQTSKRRMMTSIEKLYDARTDRRDIRLEIDVVRGRRTTYETELHEVRQAYLSSEAQNRALLARLETLETHMSRMETTYETELHEVRQAYLSSEAQNRALLARLETLETHMSRMEWQC
ncbi:hypothetical protein Tco_0641342 [Tanacetum coccineum]